MNIREAQQKLPADMQEHTRVIVEHGRVLKDHDHLAADSTEFAIGYGDPRSSGAKQKYWQEYETRSISGQQPEGASVVDTAKEKLSAAASIVKEKVTDLKKDQSSEIESKNAKELFDKLNPDHLLELQNDFFQKYQKTLSDHGASKVGNIYELEGGYVDKQSIDLRQQIVSDYLQKEIKQQNNELQEEIIKLIGLRPWALQSIVESLNSKNQPPAPSQPPSSNTSEPSAYKPELQPIIKLVKDAPASVKLPDGSVDAGWKVKSTELIEEGGKKKIQLYKPETGEEINVSIEEFNAVNMPNPSPQLAATEPPPPPASAPVAFGRLNKNDVTPGSRWAFWKRRQYEYKDEQGNVVIVEDGGREYGKIATVLGAAAVALAFFALLKNDKDQFDSSRLTAIEQDLQAYINQDNTRDKADDVRDETQRERLEKHNERITALENENLEERVEALEDMHEGIENGASFGGSQEDENKSSPSEDSDGHEKDSKDDGFSQGHSHEGADEILEGAHIEVFNKAHGDRGVQSILPRNLSQESVGNREQIRDIQTNEVIVDHVTYTEYGAYSASTIRQLERNDYKVRNVRFELFDRTGPGPRGDITHRVSVVQKAGR